MADRLTDGLVMDMADRLTDGLVMDIPEQNVI